MQTKHSTLLASFAEWLGLMGYAESSMYGHPRAVKEFLIFLENKSLKLQEADAELVSVFFIQLEKRPHKRSKGKLSANYLNKHIQSLKLFSRFLRESDLGHLPVEQAYYVRQSKTPIVLVRSEIKLLYEQSGSAPSGLRDRAILAVFYGCGLRRNEGENLDVADVLYTQNLLYVRHGKGSRERYVPMSPGVRADLMAWLEKGRPAYNPQDDSLLISAQGKRLSGQMMGIRLKELCKQADIREVTLHSLRHSIATHLLQAGMKLEEVSTFLGHSSLESTQIYTHIK